MDVHKDTAVATIKGSDFNTEKKNFLTFTEDLYDLVEWLQTAQRGQLCIWCKRHGNGPVHG